MTLRKKRKLQAETYGGQSLSVCVKKTIYSFQPCCSICRKRQQQEPLRIKSRWQKSPAAQLPFRKDGPLADLDLLFATSCCHPSSRTLLCSCETNDKCARIDCRLPPNNDETLEHWQTLTAGAVGEEHVLLFTEKLRECCLCGVFLASTVSTVSISSFLASRSPVFHQNTLSPASFTPFAPTIDIVMQFLFRIEAIWYMLTFTKQTASGCS